MSNCIIALYKRRGKVLFAPAFFFILAVSSMAAFAQEAKQTVRVYVTDRDSWQETGSLTAVNGVASGKYQGGVRRTNPEQVKSLSKSCPAITLTAAPEKADFTVVWDSKTYQETPWGGHTNEFFVYNAAKDLVGSGGTDRISSASKQICKIIVDGKK